MTVGDPPMSDSRARPGRPRALSAEVRSKIVEGVRAGLFLATACRAAGITPSCFYHWRRKARNRHPDAAGFRAFFHTVKRASAQAECEALERVRLAAGNSWQAAAWFLERRFPERWGRRRRAQVAWPVEAMSDERGAVTKGRMTAGDGGGLGR